MNKIYEVCYTWRFKNDNEIFGGKGSKDEYKFAISAHNKMDALDYFMKYYGEDEHTIVCQVYDIKTYSVEEYLYQNMNIPVVNKKVGE